jgi:hypothetical protein
MKIENKHKDTKNACASKPTLSVSNSSPSPHEKLVHQERKGPQMHFSSGVPKERSLLFGVGCGGGESKDLQLPLL